jgi:hypothetical protein
MKKYSQHIEETFIVYDYDGTENRIIYYGYHETPTTCEMCGKELINAHNFTGQQGEAWNFGNECVKDVFKNTLKIKFKKEW